MAELFIVGWFWANWQIIVAVAVVIAMILYLSKYNDSFDSNPEISKQEVLKTKFALVVVFVCLTVSASLVISYFY